MSKTLYLLSAILGVVLNLALMLLPSIFLGVPKLVLRDSRLIAFLVIISLPVILSTNTFERPIIQTQHIQARWLPYLLNFGMLIVFMTSLIEEAVKGVMPFTIFAIIGGIVMLVGVILRRLAVHELGAYFLDEVAVVSGAITDNNWHL